jgi:hypothetical protein
MRLVSAAAVVLTLAATATAFANGVVGVLDLDGRPVDVVTVGADDRAHVLIFTTTDCPVSNRYAPEIARLAARFSSKGVRMVLVYPVPGDSADRIRNHTARFGLTMPAVRDTTAGLARRLGVTVTPEVAVLARDGRMVYRGRIDDRYVELGVDRPAPTSRDLERVLDAIVSGIELTPTITPAVGCYLPDLVR